MHELSLFSGAGGSLLGTKLLGWTTIGYVEYEKYCQKLLKQRIADGILDAAPIFGDVDRFISEGYAEAYQGLVDVLSAGFPCQPFSVAGQQKAEADARNKWPQTRDCIGLIRPKIAWLENVPGILAHGYIQRIFGDLAELGYDCKWGIIGADDVGAPHRRKRLWIVADSRSQRLEKRSGISPGDKARGVPHTPIEAFNRENEGWWDTDPAEVADPESNGMEGRQRSGERGAQRGILDGSGKKTDQMPIKPQLGRVAHGVAYRVDRLKAIGNGQVPAVVRAAWEILNTPCILL